MHALPGLIQCPSLAAWNVTVALARTAAPSVSPVEASTPEAMSAATTGAPQPLMASIAAAAGSRGAPSKPVPKIASITAPEPARASAISSPGDLPRASLEALEVRRCILGELGGRPQQQRLDPMAPLSEQACGDEAIAAVVALAADDANRALAGGLGGDARQRRPGGLHELERGNALLRDRPGVDRPHPGGV